VRVLISGATGLVGTALGEALRAEGHAVGQFVRPGGTARAGDVRWDPEGGSVDVAPMEGADAVVCLSGAGIGDGRWTPERKKVLRSSRVDATRVLVDALGQIKRKPRVFISASAIGYYGDRGDEILTEASTAGNDFLAQLARDWETEGIRAETFGIRTVIVRFGVILSAKSGALTRMLTPFKLGVGGRLGSGKQWMSWVSLDDAVGIIRAAMANEGIKGPVNVVAPNPVRNADFTRTLASALHRPAIFPAPAFALRIALGEMADGLLLSSQRVRPERMITAGYDYRFGELEAGLLSILGGRS
jgi:uncharacterized protein